MSIEIIWNGLSVKEWEEKFLTISHSNLLQSYAYAKAYCPHAKQKARWGLIKIDGKEAGILQIFEVGILFNLFHAVMIDRGPLWFPGFGNAMHIKRVFGELNKQFPKKFGRKRRLLPEIEDGLTAQKMMVQTGLQKFGSGYQTIWLDLQKEEDDLRTNLKSNWRDKLSKAEKIGIEIEWDLRGVHLSWMLGIYAADKAVRNYGGPSPDFLRKYAPILISQNQFYLARALKNNEAIAFILIAAHGRSATYLAGWSGDIGRETAAHHLLLWEGIKALKINEIKEIDLGGVNDDTAEDIKTFKQGLGGRFVSYVGHYI